MVRIAKIEPNAVLIYRPSGLVSSLLLDFQDFLSCTVKLNKIFITGDFNIHVDPTNRSAVMDFLNFMDSFNFSQHV